MYEGTSEHKSPLHPSRKCSCSRFYLITKTEFSKYLFSPWSSNIIRNSIVSSNRGNNIDTFFKYRKIDFLGHNTDRKFCHFPIFIDIFSKDIHSTTRLRNQSREYVYKSGFPCSIFSEKCYKCTLWYRKVHAVKSNNSCRIDF